MKSGAETESYFKLFGLSFSNKRGGRSRGFFPRGDFPERHFSETHLSIARSLFKSNPNYKTRSIFDDRISNYSANPFQVKSSVHFIIWVVTVPKSKIVIVIV